MPDNRPFISVKDKMDRAFKTAGGVLNGCIAAIQV
jgi:hypothetical protein